MATERTIDVNELIRVLRLAAKQEVEQTRINLERELKEWKSRYGRVSSKYAKLRMHNRELRETIRKANTPQTTDPRFMSVTDRLRKATIGVP